MVVFCAVFKLLDYLQISCAVLFVCLYTMKKSKSLFARRIYTDTRILQLHRPITAIFLTITGLLVFVHILYEHCFHCYNLDTNNTAEYSRCNQDISKWAVSFVFFFEALFVYIPFLILNVGADKHPFKRLEDFQRLSEFKVDSIGHLSHIILEQLNTFIEYYRRPNQKLKRKVRMLCLFFQEMTQFIIFLINFYFLNVIFNDVLTNCSKYGFTNINSAGEVNRNVASWMESNPVLHILVPLIWSWYLILFIITLVYVACRLITYIFHQNKKFNALYWQLDDDNLVSVLGRFDFADWLFLDYVRKTTQRFVYKRILKHFADHPETTTNRGEGNEAVIYLCRVQVGQEAEKLNITCSVCVSGKLAENSDFLAHINTETV